MANIWAKYFETFVTDLEQTLGVDSAGFKAKGESVVKETHH